MRELPGKPGFVPAPAMDDPKVVVEAFRQGAINAKTAGESSASLTLTHSPPDSLILTSILFSFRL